MTNIKIKRIFESPADGNYFFGYFDTPQVSKDDARILALKVNFIDHVPEVDQGDFAEVGYFDMTKETPAFHKIGETTAFNWQQGCMLQFRGPDYLDEIIYNRFDGEKFVAEMVNLETGSRATLKSAIYAMFPCGNYALTIDFERHNWCRRGYSYGHIKDEAKNRDIVPGDGIWLLNLETREADKVISIEDMLALDPLSNMKGATHYLEHMTVNPSGSKFSFLHRWRYPEGIHSRLCVADRDGRNIKILNDSGRMSHYCWRDDERLIGYGGIANQLNRLRKNKTLIKNIFRPLLPLYHRLVKDSSDLAKKLTGDSYIEIDTTNGKISRIAAALIADDGHMAMLPGRNMFVTDIYARSKYNQKPRLYAYDFDDDEVTLLDELGSIDELDETASRCDLHPCVSPSGNIITIDTMDRGVRGIYGYRIL